MRSICTSRTRAALGLGLALLVGTAGCAAGPQEPKTAYIAGAPAGSFIDPDIAAGYARYKAPLERYGEWYSDTRFGVRWCPRDVEANFSAYQSRGHWVGSAEEATGATSAHAPPGSADSPYWVSDDSETWGDITMHHGYWVKNDWGRSCWIPGVSETPARVVWRTGNGYVGWAAEPPNWVDDTYDASAVLLDWTFVLLGALFQPRIHEQCLCSEESREAAVHATRPTVGEASRSQARRGPAQGEVRAAENALREHVAAHPVVDPANAASTAGKGPSAAPTVASNDSNSQGSSSSSSSSSKKATDVSKENSVVKVVVVPLPPGEDLFLRLRTYPYQGPLNLAPSGTALRAPARVESSEAPSHGYGSPSGGTTGSDGSSVSAASTSVTSSSTRSSSASSAASSASTMSRTSTSSSGSSSSARSVPSLSSRSSGVSSSKASGSSSSSSTSSSSSRSSASRRK